VVAGLRLRLEVQRSRRRRAEDDLASVVAENRELRARLQDATAATETADRDAKETVSSPPESTSICPECEKRATAPRPFAEPYEHDLDRLPSGAAGKLVRLKNGGSAFGSRESLCRIGLEPDDATPGREVCSAILAASFQAATAEPQPEAAGSGGGSLLAELEEQYRRLVLRYESLIEAKTATSHSETARDGHGRPQDLSIPDPTEGHFDRGPAEYKRLFSEIFKTLHRSAEYPPPTVGSPQPGKGE